MLHYYPQNRLRILPVGPILEEGHAQYNPLSQPALLYCPTFAIYYSQLLEVFIQYVTVVHHHSAMIHTSCLNLYNDGKDDDDDDAHFNVVQ